MIEPEVLQRALVDYLPKQRWFGSDEAAVGTLRPVATDVIRDDWPCLVQVLVDVPADANPAVYQVLIGLRPSDARDAFLEGKGDAILGEIETALGPAVAYDAVVDPELALCLLEQAAPGEHAERARLLGADQSNTSVVFDERLFLKLFRRVAVGPNPDVEMTRALAASGFDHVVAPIGEWEGGGGHLAVVTEYLTGGVDGFHLALTSLRDVYDARCRPEDAGGDFGPDAHRLGSITAQMHVALAKAFGTSPGDMASWVDDMVRQLDRGPRDVYDPAAVRAWYEELRATDAGPAIRIHGDFHLGQVMRTDHGWHVLDFEGEPARPVEERRRPSSALRDVAGMLRSFHYAAEVALREYGGDADDEVLALAAAWEHHNRQEFLAGYFGTVGVDQLLPAANGPRARLVSAFELDKAVYEVAYEASHRPEWVGIPLSAVQRILEERSGGKRTP